MIHHARPTHELRGAMKKEGLLTLREEGVLVALEGRTSLEEILRVTQNDDDEQQLNATNTHATDTREAA
jgi:hypothetical protein